MQKAENQIKSASIITYLQLFLNIIISIVYTPIMLRILGASEHGLYSTVSSVISWLSILSLGFGSSYIRYYSKYKVNNEQQGIASLNGLFLLLFFVIGCVAFLCGLFLSNNLHLVFADGLTVEEYKTAKILSIIVTTDLAISFPASVFNSILRSQEKFVHIKLINMFQSVCSPLVTLPILYMGYGSIGMVAVTTLIDLVAYIINFLYCLKLKTRFSFKRYEKGLFKSIAAFSIFIAINSIVSHINTSMDKILLGRFINTSSVSVYAIGFSLYTYYSSFSVAITSLFTPRIHKIVNENIDNPSRMKQQQTELFVRIGRLQFLIQMLMCTGIIFFGQPFIRFWAGESYQNSYYIAILLCVSSTVPLCQNVAVEMQRAQNKHKFRSIAYLIMSLANIVISIVLIKLFGELGAPIGTAIATIIIEWLFMNWYYQKHLNIGIASFWKEIAKMLVGILPVLAIGTVIMLFAPMQTIWGMLLFIGAYSCCYLIDVWFLVMNPYEKELVFGFFKKFRRRKV